MTALPEKNLLRPAEVAEYFSVTKRTVYLWIAEKKLDTELTPGGSLRIKRESILRSKPQDID
jgi:excisionase family DNA binding protein